MAEPFMKLPTQAELTAAFQYDRRTGILVRRSTGGTGQRGKGGQITFKLRGAGIGAHRIVWKMVYGTEPMINHRDNNLANNRLKNLRPTNYKLRGANMRRRNGRALPKGVRGVVGSVRFEARIMIEGALISLGFHDTVEAAHAAYRKAAKKRWGTFARCD